MRLAEIHPSDLYRGTGHYCIVPGDDRMRWFGDGRLCPTMEAYAEECERSKLEWPFSAPATSTESDPT